MKALLTTALLLAALAFAGAARATCTPNGTGGTCVDSLDYLEDDIVATAIQFRVRAHDENALVCTKTAEGEFQIARSETMFTERHQLLLLAAAGSLRVQVVLTAGAGGVCVVNNVRLFGS
jgi:hypothetical protein